jgi:amidase
MRTSGVPWEAMAAAKRADTLSKIRPEWRLSSQDLEQAARQRDLTGAFIQQYLNRDDVTITSMDSVPIVDAIRSRKLTAVDVATAFCKTAAVAHQIVSSGSKL